MKSLLSFLLICVATHVFAQGNLTVIYNRFRDVYDDSSYKQDKPNLTSALYVLGDSMSFFRYSMKNDLHGKFDVSGVEMHHGVIRYMKDSFVYYVSTWVKPKALTISYDYDNTPWQILNEEVEVAHLHCKVATRGNIKAWFAPSIPVRAGPADYAGLPGLIVKVYDTKFHMVFEMKEMTPGIPEIKYTKPLPILTSEEYQVQWDAAHKQQVDTTKPKKIQWFWQR